MIMSNWQNQYNLTMPEYKNQIKLDHWKCIRISEKAHLRSDFRKKYFLEWGSNPRKYYFGAIYLQGRNRKIFSLVFGSSEIGRICFRD